MIRIVNTNEDDYKKILSLRNDVLRRPLGLDIQDDDLSGEDQCIHFAYLDKFDNVIACLQVKALGGGLFQIRQNGC